MRDWLNKLEGIAEAIWEANPIVLNLIVLLILSALIAVPSFYIGGVDLAEENVWTCCVSYAAACVVTAIMNR